MGSNFFSQAAKFDLIQHNAKHTVPRPFVSAYLVPNTHRPAVSRDRRPSSFPHTPPGSSGMHGRGTHRDGRVHARPHSPELRPTFHPNGLLILRNVTVQESERLPHVSRPPFPPTRRSLRASRSIRPLPESIFARCISDRLRSLHHPLGPPPPKLGYGDREIRYHLKVSGRARVCLRRISLSPLPIRTRECLGATFAARYVSPCIDRGGRRKRFASRGDAVGEHVGGPPRDVIL